MSDEFDLNEITPDPIKEPVPEPDEDASTKPALIDSICQAFVDSERTWPTSYTGGGASSVVYFLTAIRMVAEKPFDDDEVQRKVLSFLEKMIDESSEKLMADANDRIKEALNKF